MGTEPEAFTPEIYDAIQEGARRSAEALVPIVFEEYQPRSVIDVGCGEGLWGAAFKARGAEVFGIDSQASPVIPHADADLEKPLPDLGEFDLAVCLEVAEHLTPGRGPSFVADLCRLAPVVMFSAAIPGQGGTGHLNERWPGYWQGFFNEQGFACSAALRWRIWEDDRIENWYRQNLIMCAREPEYFPGWFDSPHVEVVSVVHPVLFEHVVATRDEALA